MGVTMFALMAVAFVVFGAWCLKNALASSFKNHQATTWPTVKGKITQATVRMEQRGGSDLRPLYWPEIVVRFQVNDRWFSCENLYYGYGSTSACGVVNRDLEPFSPGESATVYYNPENPAESVLQPGFKGTNGIFLAVGSVFLILGLGLSMPLFTSKPKPVDAAPKRVW